MPAPQSSFSREELDQMKELLTQAATMTKNPELRSLTQAAIAEWSREFLSAEGFEHRRVARAMMPELTALAEKLRLLPAARKKS